LTRKVSVFEGTPAAVSTRTFLTPGVVMAAAGTVATNCVEVKDDGVMLVPLKSSVSPEAKPDPAIVRAKPAVPAVPEAGFNEMSVGPAPLTMKLTVFETLRTSPNARPACGRRFAAGDASPKSRFKVTVTGRVPATAISDAGMLTVRAFAPTADGESVVVLNRTTGTNPDRAKLAPLMVSVKAPPPAVADAGDSVVITGVGKIVKVTGAEFTPPTCTKIEAVPGETSNAAGIVTSIPLLVGVPLMASMVVFAPLVQRTDGVPPAVKFVPVMENKMSGAPAKSLSCETNEMAGAEAIVNGTKFESLDPERTKIDALPTVAKKLAGMVTDIDVAVGEATLLSAT